MYGVYDVQYCTVQYGCIECVNSYIKLNCKTLSGVERQSNMRALHTSAPVGHSRVVGEHHVVGVAGLSAAPRSRPALSSARPGARGRLHLLQLLRVRAHRLPVRLVRYCTRVTNGEQADLGCSQ